MFTYSVLISLSWISGCRMISWPSRPCYPWTWSSLWEWMIHLHRSEHLEGAWVFSCPSCVMVPLWTLGLSLSSFPVSPIYWGWEGQTRPPLLHVMMYIIFEEEQVNLSLILIFPPVAEIITSSTVFFPIYHNELKCALCNLASKNRSGFCQLLNLNWI